MVLLFLFFSQICKLLLRHKVMSDSFATPRTVARQIPLSIGFLKQEYCSGLPFPSPGEIFLIPWDQTYGIKPASPALAGDSLPLSYLRHPKYVSSCVFIAHNIPRMTFSTQSSVLCFFCIHVSWRAVHSSVWGSALCI